MSSKRIFLAALSALTIAGMLAAPVSAANVPVQLVEPAPVAISPFYANVSTTDLSLSARGTTLSIFAYVSSQERGKVVSVAVYLEEKSGSSWKRVTSWTCASTSSASISKTYTGTKGKTYRARLVAKVDGEQVTDSVTETI